MGGSARDRMSEPSRPTRKACFCTRLELATTTPERRQRWRRKSVRPASTTAFVILHSRYDYFGQQLKVDPDPSDSYRIILARS
jgi:hypothetical protein